MKVKFRVTTNHKGLNLLELLVPNDKITIPISDELYDRFIEWEFCNQHEPKIVVRKVMRKADYIWYFICHLIEEYRKLTKRSFIRDYEEMQRGN